MAGPTLLRLRSAAVVLAAGALVSSLVPQSAGAAVPSAPASAPVAAASEAQLRAAVKRASDKLAAATQAWEQGQTQLGIEVQRRYQLELDLRALHARAREAEQQLSTFASHLYRNPVGGRFWAGLSGQPRLVSDVVFLEEQAHSSVGAMREAGKLLRTRAARVQELLEAQVAAARAVTRLQAKQAKAFDTVMADLAASEAALSRHIAELRAQQAAAATSGAGCGPRATDAVNGFLPASALCPLQTAPGHRLSTPAARAFDAMSRAFQADLGQPICVTDSYRDFPGQVDVFRRKPELAATPGRSNHGWGLAVDLCGGVQRFGTQAYVWLKDHAGEFGWGHPDWAEPGGSRPEAWHWEYHG